MSNIEKHRAFIESLEGEKGLPESKLTNEFEWVETEPLINIAAWQNQQRTSAESYRVIERLLRRLRRAESRQIPDLKEKVKELVRDAMDAEQCNEHRLRLGFATLNSDAHKFRALCAPDKGGEVKP